VTYNKEDRECGDGYRSSRFPLYSEYETRPESNELCLKCKSSYWLYYHYVGGSFRNNNSYNDKFKSLLCGAAKKQVCANGFFQPKDFVI
jgi:hypothetical protein